MLNKETRILLLASIKYACFLKVVPFYWDKKENGLKHCTSKWGVRAWHCVILLFVLHSLFLFTTSIYLVSKSGISKNILHIGYFFAYTVPVLIEIGVARNRSRIPFLLNEFLAYLTKIRGKYMATDGANLEPSTLELWMWAGMTCCLLQAHITQIFYVGKPDFTIFMSAWFLDSDGQVPGYVVMFWFLPQYMVCLCVWATIIFLFPICVTCITSVIFWLREIRPTLSSKMTKDNLRMPFVAIGVHRCLTMLIILANDVFRDYMYWWVNILTILTVFANYTILRLYVTLDPFHFYCLIGLFMGATAALHLIHNVLGQVNAGSANFISSLNKCNTFDPGHRKLVKMILKSFRPCRIEMGSFGYFQIRNTTKVIRKIVYYTNKALLMIK